MSTIQENEFGQMIADDSKVIIIRDPDGAAIVLQARNGSEIIIGEFTNDLDAEEAYARALEEAYSAANVIAIIMLEAQGASS